LSDKVQLDGFFVLFHLYLWIDWLLQISKGRKEWTRKWKKHAAEAGTGICTRRKGMEIWGRRFQEQEYTYLLGAGMGSMDKGVFMGFLGDKERQGRCF